MFFLLAGAIIVVGTGCSSQESSESTTVLRIGNGAEPNTLDPHFATTMAEAHILNGLYEGLLGAPPTPGEDWEPGIALNWGPNNDFTQFAFELRPDAKWSNGKPIVAQDFVYAYQRLLDPQLGAPNAAHLYLLKNAEAYNRREITDFEKVGVKAPSTNRLELELEAATPHFLEAIAHWAWRPIHRASVEAYGESSDIANPWATRAEFASSGPYAMKSWRRNERIELRRNPHYWDSASVSIEALQFFPFENQQTEFRAFQSGQLDVTEEIPKEQLGRLPDRERREPALATTYLLLNNESAALASASFRHALSQAIDRTLLIRAVEKSGLPATRFTPSSMPRYSAEDFNSSVQSNYQLPDRPLRFLVSNRESSIAIAEAIQNMWHRKLGIEVRIQNMEFKSLLARLDEADFDISYLAWHGDYVDPTTFLNIWRSDSHFNRAQWINPDYDRFLDQARLAKSPTQRLERLAAAEALLGQELPVIPIFWKTKNYLVGPKVTYWPESLIDLRPYKHVKLAP